MADVSLAEVDDADAVKDTAAATTAACAVRRTGENSTTGHSVNQLIGPKPAPLSVASINATATTTTATAAATTTATTTGAEEDDDEEEAEEDLCAQGTTPSTSLRAVAIAAHHHVAMDRGNCDQQLTLEARVQQLEAQQQILVEQVCLLLAEKQWRGSGQHTSPNTCDEAGSAPCGAAGWCLGTSAETRKKTWLAASDLPYPANISLLRLEATRAQTLPRQHGSTPTRGVNAAAAAAVTPALHGVSPPFTVDIVNSQRKEMTNGGDSTLNPLSSGSLSGLNHPYLMSGNANTSSSNATILRSSSGAVTATDAAAVATASSQPHAPALLPLPLTSYALHGSFGGVSAAAGSTTDSVDNNNNNSNNSHAALASATAAASITMSVNNLSFSRSATGRQRPLVTVLSPTHASQSERDATPTAQTSSTPNTAAAAAVCESSVDERVFLGSTSTSSVATPLVVVVVGAAATSTTSDNAAGHPNPDSSDPLTVSPPALKANAPILTPSLGTNALIDTPAAVPMTVLVPKGKASAYETAEAEAAATTAPLPNASHHRQQPQQQGGSVTPTSISSEDASNGSDRGNANAGPNINDSSRASSSVHNDGSAACLAHSRSSPSQLHGMDVQCERECERATPRRASYGSFSHNNNSNSNNSASVGSHASYRASRTRERRSTSFRRRGSREEQRETAKEEEKDSLDDLYNECVNAASLASMAAAPTPAHLVCGLPKLQRTRSSSQAGSLVCEFRKQSSMSSSNENANSTGSSDQERQHKQQSHEQATSARHTINSAVSDMDLREMVEEVFHNQLKCGLRLTLLEARVVRLIRNVILQRDKRRRFQRNTVDSLRELYNMYDELQREWRCRSRRSPNSDDDAAPCCEAIVGAATTRPLVSFSPSTTAQRSPPPHNNSYIITTTSGGGRRHGSLCRTNTSSTSCCCSACHGEDSAKGVAEPVVDGQEATIVGMQPSVQQHSSSSPWRDKVRTVSRPQETPSSLVNDDNRDDDDYDARATKTSSATASAGGEADKEKVKQGSSGDGGNDDSGVQSAPLQPTTASSRRLTPVPEAALSSTFDEGSSSVVGVRSHPKMMLPLPFACRDSRAPSATYTSDEPPCLLVSDTHSHHGHSSPVTTATTTAAAAATGSAEVARVVAGMEKGREKVGERLSMSLVTPSLFSSGDAPPSSAQEAAAAVEGKAGSTPVSPPSITTIAASTARGSQVRHVDEGDNDTVEKKTRPCASTGIGRTAQSLTRSSHHTNAGGEAESKKSSSLKAAKRMSRSGSISHHECKMQKSPLHRRSRNAAAAATASNRRRRQVSHHKSSIVMNASTLSSASDAQARRPPPPPLTHPSLTLAAASPSASTWVAAMAAAAVATTAALSPTSARTRCSVTSPKKSQLASSNALQKGGAALPVILPFSSFTITTSPSCACASFRRSHAQGVNNNNNIIIAAAAAPATAQESPQSPPSAAGATSGSLSGSGGVAMMVSARRLYTALDASRTPKVRLARCGSGGEKARKTGGPTTSNVSTSTMLTTVATSSTRAITEKGGGSSAATTPVCGDVEPGTATTITTTTTSMEKKHGGAIVSPLSCVSDRTSGARWSSTTSSPTAAAAAAVGPYDDIQRRSGKKKKSSGGVGDDAAARSTARQPHAPSPSLFAQKLHVMTNTTSRRSCSNNTTTAITTHAVAASMFAPSSEDMSHVSPPVRSSSSCSPSLGQAQAPQSAPQQRQQQQQQQRLASSALAGLSPCAVGSRVRRVPCRPRSISPAAAAAAARNTTVVGRRMQHRGRRDRSLTGREVMQKHVVVMSGNASSDHDDHHNVEDPVAQEEKSDSCEGCSSGAAAAAAATAGAKATSTVAAFSPMTASKTEVFDREGGADDQSHANINNLLSVHSAETNAAPKDSTDSTHDCVNAGNAGADAAATKTTETAVGSKSENSAVQPAEAKQKSGDASRSKTRYKSGSSSSGHVHLSDGGGCGGSSFARPSTPPGSAFSASRDRRLRVALPPPLSVVTLSEASQSMLRSLSFADNGRAAASTTADAQAVGVLVVGAGGDREKSSKNKHVLSNQQQRQPPPQQAQPCPRPLPPPLCTLAPTIAKHRHPFLYAEDEQQDGKDESSGYVRGRQPHADLSWNEEKEERDRHGTENDEDHDGQQQRQQQHANDSYSSNEADLCEEEEVDEDTDEENDSATRMHRPPLPSTPSFLYDATTPVSVLSSTSLRCQKAQVRRSPQQQ